jgi:8-oxo-dGTP pyrophosphatase MutT (NUDIX family)
MGELIDLVNANGAIVQTGIEREHYKHNRHLYPDEYMQIAIVVVFNSFGQLLVHRRSTSHKTVNPGDIDHICGTVQAGELAAEAAVREAIEETSVQPDNLQFVTAGINEYGRWRHLFVGTSDTTPSISNPNEVSWVGHMHLDELKQAHQAGELGVVDGFYSDVDLAQAALKPSV